MNSTAVELNYQSFLSKNFFTLRSIFYLLRPNETFHENVENVPDLTAEVIFFYIDSINTAELA